MITWTPYPNLRLSAHVLSPHTLGRQITQALQLLRAATGASVGTSTLYSPAYDLWRDTPAALMVYIDGLIHESELRGCSQGLPRPSSAEGRRVYDIPKTWRRETAQMPDWLGVEKLHASHRACLTAQDAEWYAQFAWDEPPRYDVFWPGRMPSVGDWLIPPDGGRAKMVCSFDEQRRPVVADAPGVMVPVERRDIRARRWIRGIPNDL